MSEIRILKYLIENNSKSFTIREVSLKLNISYKVVYEIIQRLKNENLISFKKIGNASQIKFNYNLNKKVLDAETQRKEDILKNKNLKIISKRFDEIDSPFFIALLFGSYTTNKQSKNSDIDICLISDSKEILKVIESELSLIPLDIHITDFTSKEFISMLKTKEFNVGHEIVKNNIILHGIENYYKLLKNE